MRIEENQGRAPAQASATAEQILGEIRDYCRETRTAESTFGRLVVNDGKLVCRGCATAPRSRPVRSTRSAPICPSIGRPRRRHKASHLQ